MTPASDKPLLELADAEPEGTDWLPGGVGLSLALPPGAFALVQARDPVRAAGFADLCCGLVPLRAGAVRCLGRDWAALPPLHAAALRGRIGRVFADGAWLETMGVAEAILLPALHHTRLDAAILRERAAMLAGAFGLPGLPLERPRAVASADLARAACVRACLGEPMLLLMETPVQGRHTELVSPLLGAVGAARDRGAAVLWLTASELVWRDRSVPATLRLRLAETGLVPARRTEKV